MNEEYLDCINELEREHRKMLSSITLKDDLAAFPEAKEILKRNKVIFEKRLDSHKNEIVQVVNEMKSQKKSSDEIDIVLKLLLADSEIQKLFKYLDFIDRYLMQINMGKTIRGKSKSKDLTNDIQKAKAISIVEVCNYLRIELNNLFAKCPFHNERTPSLKVYQTTNTFYCWGCNAHGSQIDLVMKLCNKNFIGAVNLLINQFK